MVGMMIVHHAFFMPKIEILAFRESGCFFLYLCLKIEMICFVNTISSLDVMKSIQKVRTAWTYRA